MASEFIDIGFGNIAQASRIICVAAAESSPVRRMMQDSKDRGTLVPATPAGRPSLGSDTFP